VPFRLALILAFLLGAAIALASLKLIPLVSVGNGDVEELSLVVPAIASKTYS
jgi:hypothetical protein